MSSEEPPPGKPVRRLPTRWRFPGFYLLALLALLWFWTSLIGATQHTTIPYSQFKNHLANGEVVEAKVELDVIVGRIEPHGDAATQPEPREPAPRTQEPSIVPPVVAAKEPFSFRTVRVEDPELVAQLEAAKVRFVGERPGFLSQFLWGWFLPILFLVLLFTLMFRRSAGPSVLSMGKSRAKLVADRSTDVTFADVAGCDEAKEELQEVVDFLRNPDRYRALGAKIPKGVLLVGPPGTGKTLLARAVAGEASVPFFSLSGSDFIEMFVGVGAARVRDLFVQATQKAPCIIFIDELDAIGRQRGVHVAVVNDEREQTLNQLLVEMDGFEVNKGVILLAATNRPDVLDKALLRPGRFDRQVVVDAPDIDGREAILRVHARNKPLANQVNLRRIAQATPGMSGADLANAMNEAALLAARRGGNEITQLDLENAVEKVVAGPERKSRRLSEEDKQRVAYHEVGHSIVRHYLSGPGRVHKITIVPRGKAALGYTMSLPEENQFLMTQTELVHEITTLLGGRAAEEVIFNEVSTGASNDLERATALARQMVCSFGMSDVVGLTHCARHVGPRYLDPDATQIDCSDETARKVDDEVARLLGDAYLEAKRLLVTHRHQLERVAHEILTKESIDGPTFEALLREPGAIRVK